MNNAFHKQTLVVAFILGAMTFAGHLSAKDNDSLAKCLVVGKAADAPGKLDRAALETWAKNLGSAEIHQRHRRPRSLFRRGGRGNPIRICCPRCALPAALFSA